MTSNERKTGSDWLNVFLNTSDAERARGFQFRPDPELIRLGHKHTIETHLGTIYDRILYEREKEKAYEDIDTRLRRSTHIRTFVEEVLKKLGKDIASLQENPTSKTEIAFSTYTSPSLEDVEQKMLKDMSGYDLAWHLTKAEYIEWQVKKAALLRALNFPLGNDNMVSTQPNFGVRIATSDGSKRVMLLHWGWGNPHVFYAVDITKLEGTTPTFTLTDKLIVASAYEIAKGSKFLSSFPQDMVRRHLIAA